ncbi:uncharacterized protein LOC132323214 [Haemorhous mexicanus]|uniref:uncharacterized protein LOC132323214 n=1 Tax=Haemorhous mexicanus TaxID=30427 RepID=UPI0028BDF658|nr:uncharacterized protein LOC132323214 [Haemorhous mexicanus]
MVEKSRLDTPQRRKRSPEKNSVDGGTTSHFSIKDVGSPQLDRETNAGQIPSASPRWLPKGEDGAAAAHPTAIQEGGMAAPGREGAQECMASCFRAMAAAEPIRPPATNAAPPTTAARPVPGGAGDTDRRLGRAAGLHALLQRGWPTAPQPWVTAAPAPTTALQMYCGVAPICITSATTFVCLRRCSSGCPEAQTLILTPNHLTTSVTTTCTKGCSSACPRAGCAQAALSQPRCLGRGTRLLRSTAA